MGEPQCREGSSWYCSSGDEVASYFRHIKPNNILQTVSGWRRAQGRISLAQRGALQKAKTERPEISRPGRGSPPRPARNGPTHRAGDKTAEGVGHHEGPCPREAGGCADPACFRLSLLCAAGEGPDTPTTGQPGKRESGLRDAGQWEDQVRTKGAEAVYEPRRDMSRESNPAGTVICSCLGGSQLCCSSHPVCCIS